MGGGGTWTLVPAPDVDGRNLAPPVSFRLKGARGVDAREGKNI